jgi:hypothetical protein
MAKLVIQKQAQEVITTKSGSHQNEVTGKTTALFSTSGDYLAAVEGEIRKFDPTAGTTFTKMQVDWRKQSRAAIAPAPQTAEVQKIDDPCHPDYVGPGECVEGTEVQKIDDPCHPDYVGPGECPAEGGAAAPTASPPKSAEPAKPGKKN